MRQLQRRQLNLTPLNWVLATLILLSFIMSLFSLLMIAFVNPLIHGIVVVVLLGSIQLALAYLAAGTRWAATGFVVWLLVKWVGLFSVFSSGPTANLDALFASVLIAEFLVFLFSSYSLFSRQTNRRRKALTLGANTVGFGASVILLAAAALTVSPTTLVQVETNQSGQTEEVWEGDLPLGTRMWVYQVDRIGPFVRHTVVSRDDNVGF